MTTRNRSTQEPQQVQGHPPSAYRLYPTHLLSHGNIRCGFAELAEELSKARRVMIDGYVGVNWETFMTALTDALTVRGRAVNLSDVRSAMLSETEIEALLAPYLGGDDPLFGTRTTLELGGLFEHDRLPRPGSDLAIVYGCGAALCKWEDALTLYVDLPKNEIQYRSRAGSAANLGLGNPLDPPSAYKRFYFADWVMLNRYKAAILPKLDYLIDGQNETNPTFASGETLRGALKDLSARPIRARPWMEPGTWGGQWLKTHIQGPADEAPNYAWSFELITPENGLLLEEGGQVLEISFDTLMFQESDAILGDHAKRFGTQFPIRFDYLDTIAGGNLSVQCHPRPDYMEHHFGESFTQDETYYIVHHEPEAKVFLGFKEGVDREAFLQAATESEKVGTPVDVEAFLNVETSERHALYLIPNGTVHGSGAGNLVLEISATPYIFTFKIYDWLRKGGEGQPRPLNVARAMDNLYFSEESRELRHLIAKPIVLRDEPSARVVHLPTHEEHFYDVHQLELRTSLRVETCGTPHVLCLVEGEAATVHVGGSEATFYCAETFIIPAGVREYTLSAQGGQPVKLVKAFLKPSR